MLAPAAKLTSGRRLVEAGRNPLPDRITPNSLRRTFASVLYTLGEDPGIVIDETEHTDPALALCVYRQAMRCDKGEKDRPRALVEGVNVADGGRQETEHQTAAAMERLSA